MRTLRICASIVLLNTAVLWSIIASNQGSTETFPSKGLVAWAVINGVVAFVTQVISLIGAVEEH